MKANLLMWSLCVSGAYTLGWNWGWGYYRTFKIRKMDGFGGYLGHYKYQKGDLALITDPIHLSNRNQITVDQAKRIRDANKKVVYICYESLNANDFPIGTLGKSYRPKVEVNPNWRAMMENCDLLVVADPHDKFAIENNPNLHDIKYPKVIHLPLAVDHRLFTPQKTIINKACFIGSRMIAHREKYLKPIPATLIDYPRMVNHGTNYLAKLKDTQNYVSVLGKYAVNLNIRTLFAGLQLRIYETMALGRVCVSHKPENIGGRIDIWKDLKNVIWYNNSLKNPNQKGIIKTLKDILHDKKKAAIIGQKARQEIIKNHTHDVRINQIMKELGING